MMHSPRSAVPMTKAQKLRRASRACWFLSAIMTSFVIYGMLETLQNTVIRGAITVGVSFGLQYVFSLGESALFDGSLPPPWTINWTEGGPLPWLFVGSIVCLIPDVMINLSGAQLFTQQIKNVDAVVVTVLSWGLGLFIAIGPELFDTWADYLDGATPRVRENRHEMPSKSVEPSNKPVEEPIRRRVM